MIHAPSLRPTSSIAVHLALAIALMIGEILIVSLLFSFEVDLPRWRHPVVLVRSVALIAILTAVATTALIWTDREKILKVWRRSLESQDIGTLLISNAAAFIVTAAASVALTHRARHAATPPWDLFAAYCVPLSLLGLTLVRLIAPIPFLLRLAKAYALRIGAAAATAIAIIVVGEVAKEGWEFLSDITLSMSHAILGFYEHDPYINYQHKILGLQRFGVRIDSGCSGYEGMSMIAGVMIVYLFAFRATLRFPHALILIPVGIASIFLLNSVRIAALVSIGEHISADLAYGGFHSQIGWITFLTMTLLLVAAAHNLSYFSTSRARPVIADEGENRLLPAYIMPFAAFMAAMIAADTMAPYDHMFYGLRVLFIGVAVYWFRRELKPVLTRPSLSALTIGLIVGVAWIVTEPVPTSPTRLHTWIQTLPTLALVAWLVFRGIGTIVCVPIAEELFFRGVLYRRLIAQRFETVPLSTPAVIPMLVTSLAFGLMHDRWFAGALAGLVFSLITWRTNRLSEAIGAHASANAVIFGWALLTARWSLL